MTSVRPEVMAEPGGLVETIAALFREIAKFGVVGLGSLVVDIGLFNYLAFGHGALHGKPITAKAISVAVATIAAYFGNRYWTFRHLGRTHIARELPLFFVLNAVAMGISLGCLWLSHYALGMHSALADNISANVIGLGLGTLFRFWSYRRWVFRAVGDDAADLEAAERDAATVI